jgi:hypothetical protein
MTNAAVHIEGQQPSLHVHVHDALASGVSHAKGQQHPIKLYLVVWGLLFVLSTCSYLIDYFGLHGYLRWSLILLFMVLKATGAGICGDHGVRIRLHASPPGHIFRTNDVEGGRL